MPPSARRARPQARRPRHRQTTLNFAPVARDDASSSLDPRGAAGAPPQSSPARAPSPPSPSPPSPPPLPPPQLPPRCSNIEVVIFTPPKNPPAARTLPLGAVSPTAKERATSIHLDSSDGEESDVVLASARKRRRSWEQGAAVETVFQADDQDEDVVTPQANRRRRGRIIQSDSEDSSDGLPDDEPPSTRRRRLNHPKPPSSIGEDEDGDEDLLVSSAVRSARKLQPLPSKPGMLLELGIGSDEDSDTDMLLTRQETNGREVDSEEKNDSDMDDDIELASKTRSFPISPPSHKQPSNPKTSQQFSIPVCALLPNSRRINSPSGVSKPSAKVAAVHSHPHHLRPAALPILHLSKNLPPATNTITIRMNLLCPSLLTIHLHNPSLVLRIRLQTSQSNSPLSPTSGQAPISYFMPDTCVSVISCQT